MLQIEGFLYSFCITVLGICSKLPHQVNRKNGALKLDSCNISLLKLYEKELSLMNLWGQKSMLKTFKFILLVLLSIEITND